MDGAQPALLVDNPDITRVIIIKPNSLAGLRFVEEGMDGREARSRIEEELRSRLKAGDWALFGRLPIIAGKRADGGDEKLRGEIDKLIRGVNDFASGMVREHRGIQWALLKPLNAQPEEINIIDVFREHEDPDKE